MCVLGVPQGAAAARGHYLCRALAGPSQATRSPCPRAAARPHPGGALLASGPTEMVLPERLCFCADAALPRDCHCAWQELGGSIGDWAA